MKKLRSSVSETTSYKKISEFWDAHDLSEFWHKTRKASFEIAIESEVTYYAVDKILSDKIQSIAQKRGVTADIHDTKSQGENGDFPQDLKLDAPIPCI